jgi:O-antigen/teichoic acid export membrane protein
MAAISCGQPAIPLRVNLFGLMIYLPGLYAAITHFGLLGAAASYAGLNLFYLLTLLPIIQSRIIKQGYFKGLQKNLCPFVVIGVLAFGLGKFILTAFDTTTILSIAFITGCSIAYLICAYFFLSPDLRHDLAGSLKPK